MNNRPVQLHLGHRELSFPVSKLRLKQFLKTTNKQISSNKKTKENMDVKKDPITSLPVYLCQQKYQGKKNERQSLHFGHKINLVDLKFSCVSFWLNQILTQLIDYNQLI